MSPADGEAAVVGLAEAPSSEDPQGEAVAALDLGSNSFHLIVARLRGAELHVVDRHKETVRLAAGLGRDARLDPEVQARALACLERMGQRLREIPRGRVRVVGTNTLRHAKGSGRFLREAGAALGHPIQIISGIEEARLIYGGVVRDLAPGARRLVVDVGGGSTELIIGQDGQPELLESLYMGCVSFTRRYFADGRISRKRMTRATVAAMLELEPVISTFRRGGWEEAWGASGTIKAVDLAARTIGCDGIDLAAVEALRERCLDLGRVERLAGELGIGDDRAPVFIGGLCVVSALVEALELDRLRPASGALREGLLYDLVGRIQQRDVRTETVARLQQRYAVDAAHAERVMSCALGLLEALGTLRDLPEEATDLLRWAASLHEVGLAIAHSGHHKHGEYVLRHADLPGFSREEQEALAVLVRSHRRKLAKDLIACTPPPYDEYMRQLVCMLRLSVILNRSRTEEPVPIPGVRYDDGVLSLRFPDGWLDGHALSAADLALEAGRLRNLDVELEVR